VIFRLLDLHTHLSKRHGELLDLYAKKYEYSDRRQVLEKAIELLDAMEGVDISEVLEICKRRKAEEALRERVKELNCLYGISELMDKYGDDTQRILDEIVYFIPEAWKYPNVACARIVCDKYKSQTRNFKETSWRQVSDIKLKNEKIGQVEIYYLIEKPLRDEGPFLNEERALLNMIAERIGRLIEKEKIQGELKKEETKFQSLIEKTSAGVAITDIKGIFTYVNDAICKMTGYSKGEMIGKNFADFLHPSDKKKIVGYFLQSWARPKRKLNLEFRIIHKDGSPVYMYSSPTIFFHNNKIVGFNAIVHDITKLKELEEQLKKVSS
jgi:PAS domain S-box-containing protein